MYLHRSVLADKRVILGITGGVAAYKSAELARFLKQAGACVQVVMTEAATRFVGSATFQALTGESVLLDAWWNAQIPQQMPHIHLGQSADALVVAPAGANFLAKIANGLCDDLLSTLCLARSTPLFVAPAMNLEMWRHPATLRNVKQLQEDGVVFWGPGSGLQACGADGVGRMLEPAELFERLISVFSPKLLVGLRVLLTVGPTFEPIDAVRGVTNRSSGRMGMALARACARAGAQVTVVSGPVACPVPVGVSHQVVVQTACEMLDAVMAQMQLVPDLFVATAAVSDWRPAERSAQKIKGVKGERLLPLVANPDILQTVASLPRPPFCVGFAAESENLEQFSVQKRQFKGVPLLVGNLVQDAVDQEYSTVLLVDEEGTVALPQLHKEALAGVLVREIASRMNRQQGIPTSLPTTPAMPFENPIGTD